MVKKDVKQLTLAIIVIVCLFVVFIGLGFLFNRYKSSENKAYNLGVKFSDNRNVYLENTLPVTDKIGRELDGVNSSTGIYGFKEFSIENNYDKKVDYQIYLRVKNSCENIIDEDFIKLYLTDTNNNPLSGFENNKLPSYSSISSLNDKPDGKLLYTGSINKNSISKFRLRVWVSDLYSINRDKECFSFDIYVRSI